VQGNILDHEYHIREGRDKAAEVSKKWFRVRDSYGVETVEPENDIWHERTHEKRLGATKTKTVEHLFLGRSFYDPSVRLGMITEG